MASCLETNAARQKQRWPNNKLAAVTSCPGRIYQINPRYVATVLTFFASVIRSRGQMRGWGMFWSSHCADARLTRFLRFFLFATLLVAHVSASAAESNKTLLNKNADALPIGITFHPDVPAYVRRGIIDDLQWLSTRGSIEDERLRHLLQIDTPMTGTSIVAWFLDRIHVIGRFGWCPQLDFVAVRFNGAGYVVNKSPGRCSPPSSGTLAYVLGARVNRFQLLESMPAILIDGKVRVVPETWPNGFSWPVMLVSPQFFNGDRSVFWRTYRLAVLLHEAAHIEGMPHAMCKLDDWKLTDFVLGPFTFPSSFRLGDRFCDDPSGGSVVTIEASFLRAIAEACNCSPKEKLMIKFLEWNAWKYQGVSFKEAIVTPADGDLQRIKGLGGKTLKTFPPAEFTAAGLQYAEWFLETCEDRCSGAERFNELRDQLLALRAFGNELKERGAFAGSWESSQPKKPPLKRPLDVDGAARWIAAAAKAPDSNVETMSLVSCADLQDKC